MKKVISFFTFYLLLNASSTVVNAEGYDINKPIPKGPDVKDAQILYDNNLLGNELNNWDYWIDHTLRLPADGYIWETAKVIYMNDAYYFLSSTNEQRGNITKTAKGFKFYLNGQANGGGGGKSRGGRPAGITQKFEGWSGSDFQFGVTMRDGDSGTGAGQSTSALDLLDGPNPNTAKSVFPEFNKPGSNNNALRVGRFTIQEPVKPVYIFFSMYPKNEYTNIFVEGLSIIDINQHIEEARKKVTDLFTDSTHTDIKPGTGQDTIDAARKFVNDKILNTVERDDLLKEIDKAQKILDSIVNFVETEDLVNNPLDIRSNTVKGKTYKHALVLMVHKEVQNVTADAEGNFEFTLPEGTYFKKGELVMFHSTVHGKIAEMQKKVLNTIPPATPILSELDDTKVEFIGKADPLTDIEIFKEGEATPTVATKANALGDFSVTIPSEKLPLTPYIKYYAVSIDSDKNVSERSTLQEVKDTKPPTADAVQQYWEKGKPFTIEPSLLVTNVQDNGGTAEGAITYKLEEAPKIDELGYAIAKVSISDRQKNKTIKEVPVFVYDESISFSSNKEYAIQASSFGVEQRKYPNTEQALNDLLLEKAALAIWDIKNQQQLNKQLVTLDTNNLPIPKSNYYPAPGKYIVTASYGELPESKLRKEFEVEIVGSLAKANIVFKNEIGEELHKAVSIEGIIGEKFDLTKEQQISEAISQIEAKNYQLVQRPANEATFELTEAEQILEYTFNGTLMILSAPNQVDFGVQQVGTKSIEMNKPVLDLPFVISDTRASKAPWRLTAKLQQQFLNEKGVEITQALYYKKDNKEIFLDTESKIVESMGDDATAHTINLSDNWTETGDGLKFSIHPGDLKQLGKYQAKILWELASVK